MDGAELNKLIAEIKAKQTVQPESPPHSDEWTPPKRREPEALERIIERVSAELLATPCPDPEKAEQLQREKEAAERTERWRAFADPLGPRYAGCRLSNFAIAKLHEKVQQSVIGEIRVYAENLPQRLVSGQGVLLYGPSGTGKDHLLTALARVAIMRHGVSVCWINGVDFYRRIRDRLDSRDTEQELVEQFSWPTILYFSDPLPPIGDLTPFQAATLFSVIDRRYRDKKPTWLSLNVADAAEAERRLGPSIADRLRDGTLALRCNWPSYRRAAI
jgi:DNA replication protein DnaC